MTRSTDPTITTIRVPIPDSLGEVDVEITLSMLEGTPIESALGFLEGIYRATGNQSSMMASEIERIFRELGIEERLQ